jgi:hypothetical protein
MSRIYRVTFEAVAVSAAQDLVQIIGASGVMVRIRRCWVGATDTTLPTNQQISLRCRFLPATVTNGSGGSAPTPQKVDPGDAAAAATAKTNSTTPATTSGTAVVLDEQGTNLYAGLDISYVGAGPCVPASTAFVFELLSTVSGTVHLSGGVEFEEIG